MASSALEALLDCAEAIESGDLRLADSRLDGILALAAQQPAEKERKLVKYFAEALVRRAYGLQDLAANFSLHLCPPDNWVYEWWMHGMKDDIQKEVMRKKRFHLIDFHIPHQYGRYHPLFTALRKSYSNGRQSVRVSVVLPPCLKEIVNVDQENKYLTKEAEGFGLEMEELKVVYANSLSEVDGDASILDLTRREDEGVLVFYNCELQRMLGEEGGMLEREFIKLRDINPDLVIIVEQNADLHHSDYIKRLKESFQYYSLALQYHGCYPVRENHYRRQIMNIVGCEGSDRIVRPQALKQWKSLLEDAHFSKLSLVSGYDGPHPIKFASAWKLRDLGQPLNPIRYKLSNPIGSNQIPPIPSQIYPQVVNRFFILLKRRNERFPQKYLKHHSFDSAIATESQVLKGFETEGLKDATKLFLQYVWVTIGFFFMLTLMVKSWYGWIHLSILECPMLREKQIIKRWFLEFVLPSLGLDHEGWLFYDDTIFLHKITLWTVHYLL